MVEHTPHISHVRRLVRVLPTIRQLRFILICHQSTTSLLVVLVDIDLRVSGEDSTTLKTVSIDEGIGILIVALLALATELVSEVVVLAVAIGGVDVDVSVSIGG